MIKKVTTPLDKEQLKGLNAGDKVLISGVIYTARDAAHKKLDDLLNKGEALPIELANQIIYYSGPAPAKPNKPIGSAGPTTSYRMDSFAPRLIAEVGLTGMIGKGDRSQEVKNAIVKHGAVYFAAVGGAGALLASCVKSCEVVAYPELQSEAIHKLVVEDFPAFVVLDCYGENLYVNGQKQYLESL